MSSCRSAAMDYVLLFRYPCKVFADRVEFSPTLKNSGAAVFFGRQISSAAICVTAFGLIYFFVKKMSGARSNPVGLRQYS